MIAIPHKAKQFGVYIIKVLIVILAFYFIYNKLTNDDQMDWDAFWKLAEEKFTFFTIFILLLFSVLNRFFEILKWQNLVSSIQKISVYEATKQVLGALTLAIFTPNGLGEYAGKALFFKMNQAKQIVFLNLVCNGIQMIITILFGTLGLIFLGYWKWALIIIALATSIFTVGLLTKNFTIKGYSIQKLIEKINEIPAKIHKKNTILAVFRYLFFSHQYYFLFVIFGVDVPYITLISGIAAVYFLASSLPSFQFLDFAVKGSVAIFFFEKLGISDLIVVFISLLMWFLNVVLPVVIGNYFVLKFKPKWT
jgi:hypothetical protein